MSQTIYARVPEQVKEATDSYAATSGLTLAGAVSDLLDRGLQAVSDASSVSELRQTVSDIRAEVEKLQEELQTLTGRRIEIKIQEVTRPEIEAQLISEDIAEQLKKRSSFRRTFSLPVIVRTSPAAPA